MLKLIQWLCQFRLFRIYGVSKLTESTYITSTTPDIRFDASTEPDISFLSEEDIGITDPVSTQISASNDFLRKRNRQKSYIEKLIQKIEGLNKSLRKLTKKSFDSDDPDSSIDVFNFYQLAYPQIKDRNEHLVSKIIPKYFQLKE